MATMASLPTDIMANILSRLPVKLLLRLKIICKSWYALIKTPNFIKLHITQTLNSCSDHHLLLCFRSIHSSELDLHHNANTLSFSELNHPLKGHKISFLGSCNGVLCIYNHSYNDVFLFNPMTKSHYKLPASPTRSNEGFGFMRKDVVKFGFGYDRQSDDYKVLRLVQSARSNEEDLGFYNEAKVFSLKNNSWTCIEGIPLRLYHHPFYPLNRYGVILNDAIHFTVYDSQNTTLIASFDFRTETYSFIDFPNYDGSSNTALDLNELGGCLCIMVNYCTMTFVYKVLLRTEEVEREFYGAEIWVMKEYGKKESWVKLFSICNSENSLIRGPIRTVVSSKDGKRILLEFDVSGLCWYDLETKCFEECSTNGLPESYFEAGIFSGSLVSFVDDEVQAGCETVSRKKKKRNDADKFLSTGFKLKL